MKEQFENELKDLGFVYSYETWRRSFDADSISISMDLAEGMFLVTFEIDYVEYNGKWTPYNRFDWLDIFNKFCQMRQLLSMYQPE